MAEGLSPTLIPLRITLLAAVSITETVSSRTFATKTLAPSGVMATASGYRPTLIGRAVGLFVAVLITETVLLRALET